MSAVVALSSTSVEAGSGVAAAGTSSGTGNLLSTQPPLLDACDFSLEFRTRSGTVQAIEQVSLQLRKGEIVGLVGESGSGKSVLSYAMLGISDAAARVTGGSATLGGIDLLRADEATLADLRGREISMIFQSPR
ncbi:MAG: ATP-binding cassette domain-containing protein, partial [Rubrivivax sp.]